MEKIVIPARRAGAGAAGRNDNLPERAGAGLFPFSIDAERKCLRDKAGTEFCKAVQRISAAPQFAARGVWFVYRWAVQFCSVALAS
jgi:hypothetical protein